MELSFISRPDTWIDWLIALTMSAVGVFVGKICIAAAREAWRDAGRAAASHSTPIRDVEEGEVHLEGRLEPVGRGTPNPYDGKECIAWSMLLRGEEGEFTKIIASASARCDAWVWDETGRARIEVDGEAHIDARRRASRRWRYWRRVPRHVREFAASHAADEYSEQEQRYSLELRCLRPGDPVHVHGIARIETVPHGQGAGYRTPPRQLVIAPGPERPLRLSYGTRRQTIRRDRLGAAGLFSFGLALLLAFVGYVYHAVAALVG